MLASFESANVIYNRYDIIFPNYECITWEWEGANGFVYDVFELLLSNKIVKFTELQ